MASRRRAAERGLSPVSRRRQVLEIAVCAALTAVPTSVLAVSGAGKVVAEVKAPADSKPVSQTDHSEKQAPPPRPPPPPQPIRRRPAGPTMVDAAGAHGRGGGRAGGGGFAHATGHPPPIVALPSAAASKLTARKQLAPGGHLGVGGLRKAASFTEPVLIGVRDLTFYLHPDADDDGSLGELRILGPDGHLACGPTRDYCHLEASPGSEYTLVVRNIGMVTGFFSIELAGPRDADIASKQTR